MKFSEQMTQHINSYEPEKMADLLLSNGPRILALVEAVGRMRESAAPSMLIYRQSVYDALDALEGE